MTTPTPTPAPSTRHLGHFRLLRELGGGELTLVYHAFDEWLGRDVALKVLRPAYARDGRWRAGFLSEARKVAALDHENVVKVWTLGEEQGMPVVAYEFVPGESLEQRVDRHGRMPMAVALPMLRQVAAALDHVHGAGLCHGDVKPANLLVSELRSPGDVQRVTLVDFGLARSGSEGGPTGGTPEYMAPELFNGSQPSLASDVYALGATAYQLLAGRTPFSGNEFKLALDHGKEPVPRAQGISYCAFRAIQRAMAKDPRQRWPSAGAFVKALDEWCLPPWLPYAVAGAGLALVALVATRCGGEGAGDGDGGSTPTAITSQTQTPGVGITVTDTPPGGNGTAVSSPATITVPVGITGDAGGFSVATDTPPPPPTATATFRPRPLRPTAAPNPTDTPLPIPDGGDEEDPDERKPEPTDPPRPTDPPKPTDYLPDWSREWPRPTPPPPPLPLRPPDPAPYPSHLSPLHHGTDLQVRQFAQGSSIAKPRHRGRARRWLSGAP